jgi:hypothetical protein
MNFQNEREVFVNNGLKNKTLSQNLHRHHKLGESKPYLSPIFQASIFSCFGMILSELFRQAGDEFGKKKRVFCSERDHLKIPPLGFTNTSHSGRKGHFR